MSTASPGPLRQIGRVHSPLEHPADAPKQGYEGAPPARLHIEAAYLPALDGLEVGDDILILTWLHQARRDVLAVHPRDDETRPLTGVFATRSADRPNPIGVHRARLLAVESDGTLQVDGLEAVDGTPVIDIKPALPQAGGW